MIQVETLNYILYSTMGFIKNIECHSYFISYSAKLGYNIVLTPNYFRRVVETNMNSFADLANKSGTCLILPKIIPPIIPGRMPET